MDVKCVLALRRCTRVKVVLKQIFGPKRNKASVQLRVFVMRMSGFTYTYNTTVRTVKQRKLRWIGYVVRTRRTRNTCRIFATKFCNTLIQETEEMGG